MIELTKSEGSQRFTIYTLTEDNKLCAIGKMRAQGDNAELHFIVYSYKYSHFRQYKHLFNTVIKQDAEALACNKIIAIADKQTTNIQKTVHFWELMGFNSFCAVKEV